MIIFITHRENTIINMVCYAFLYIFVFIGHIYYYVRPYTISYAAKQYDFVRKNSCQFQSSCCIFMKFSTKLEKCISYIFCFGEEMIFLLVLKIKQLLLKTRREKSIIFMTPFRLNIFFLPKFYLNISNIYYTYTQYIDKCRVFCIFIYLCFFRIYLFLFGTLNQMLGCDGVFAYVVKSM